MVVAPKAIIGVWEQHIHDLLFPIFGQWTLTGTKKQRQQVWDSYIEHTKTDPGILICNWAGLKPNREYLLDIVWDHIIADEAHYAKNRKAERTKALKYIRAKTKRGLTGTPVINRPDELWSLLNWLKPKEYSSYWKFFNRYVHWTKHYLGFREVHGPINLEELRDKIKPLYIRRLKSDVLKELPDKYYTDVPVELTKQQRTAYEDMRKDSLAWVGSQDDEALPAPTVLAKLTRLRQFAVTYCSVDEDGHAHMTEPSAKLDALIEIIEDTDEPIVVFDQFKQSIMLASERLDNKDIDHRVITGDVPHDQREEAIRDFQMDRDVRVILLTMQTGGAGITLHRASTAVFLSRSWSPAVNEQAEDRLHRIGQKAAVQIITLTAKDTVDSVVEEALERKKSWIKKILGG